MNTNLSKIKDCGQIWDNMPNCAGGKFCLKCNETIHDFRGMTDWEIAIKHSESDKKVCGIYDQKRLNQPTINTESKLNSSKIKMVALMGTLASSSISRGQITDQLIQSNQIEIPMKSDAIDNYQNEEEEEKYNLVKDSTMIVTGIVRDINQNTIIGANIIIKGTKNGTITGIDGDYSIDVSEEFTRNDSIILIFQYIGFAREEKIVTKSKFIENQEIEIDVVFTETENLEVFGVRRLPWYKRMWNKIF